MFREICEKVGFCREAEEAFCNAYDKIKADIEAAEKMRGMLPDFIMTENNAYEKVLSEIGSRLDINIYTLNMVFAIMAAEPMRYIYYARGISEQIYLDTLRDMKYKAEECRRMYNVWGTFVPLWYHYICCGDVIALGRLQFQKVKSPIDYKDIVKKGDTVISCHIPSGSPLDMEKVRKSFDTAYKFFGGDDEKMAFFCDSWLLYPPQYELYPECANLRKFCDIWDVAEQRDENHDFWRVFYKPEDTDLDTIEPQNRFEKNLLEHLKNGGSMGCGRAMFIYDPKKAIR